MPPAEARFSANYAPIAIHMATAIERGDLQAVTAGLKRWPLMIASHNGATALPAPRLAKIHMLALSIHRYVRSGTSLGVVRALATFFRPLRAFYDECKSGRILDPLSDGTTSPWVTAVHGTTELSAEVDARIVRVFELLGPCGYAPREADVVRGCVRLCRPRALEFVLARFGWRLPSDALFMIDDPRMTLELLRMDAGLAMYHSETNAHVMQQLVTRVLDGADAAAFRDVVEALFRYNEHYMLSDDVNSLLEDACRRTAWACMALTPFAPPTEICAHDDSRQCMRVLLRAYLGLHALHCNRCEYWGHLPPRVPEDLWELGVRLGDFFAK